MTEAEWLTSTDPAAMLAVTTAQALPADRAAPYVPVVPPFTSDRKLRLFATACCRQVWEDLTDPRSQRAVEVAERFADGEATAGEMQQAFTESLWGTPAIGLSTPVAQVAEWAVQECQNGFRQSPATQADLLHDVFGNPWRVHHQHVPFHKLSAWLAWNDGAIPKAAQQMYDARDFTNMPLLAGALEAAGCEDADILAHCRGPGPHVRGCWVADILLNKI